jgi:hypothetical protein
MRVSISQLRRIIREAADAAAADYPAWIDALPETFKDAAKNAVKGARGDESKIKDIKERFEGAAAYFHDKGHGPRA